MTTPVFPTLKGIAWPMKKRPMFRTTRIEANSGREVRVSHMRYPRYEFELKFNWLDQDDVDELLGFFLARKGSHEAFFLNVGLGDNEVTDASFGVGDGTTKTFTLFRSTGGAFAEPVGGSFGTRVAKKNGIAADATFSDDDNTVTYDVAPGNGVALQWSGNYYYLCRFTDDESQFEQFASRMYEARTVKLKSLLQAIVP